MKPYMKILAAALFLSACAETQAPISPQSVGAADFPSVHKQFACLPDEAAFVAAHRGVSKGEGQAENSKGGLDALMAAGILFAEVDIVGLKDGVHALYHDGVWETKTTGRGAVAASTWDEVSTFLLNDTEGNLTSDRPIRLTDYLALAKDRIYVEIDFKSSAKYETVIAAIRDAGMEDQVILIAYNNGQAKKLAALAPEMMISVSVNQVGDIKALNMIGVTTENMAAWRGDDETPDVLFNALKSQGIPILKSAFSGIPEGLEGEADLIVSDFALGAEPIIGLTGTGRAAYEACLKS